MSTKTVSRRAVRPRTAPAPDRAVKEVDGDLFTVNGAFPCVLGIDQSYSGFGLTAMALDGAPVYHSWVYKAPGTGIGRLQAIDFFLYSILERLTDSGHPVRISAMEGYAYGSQMANMAGELGAVVKLCLANYFDTTQPDSPGYPLIVPPSSLKKYAVGRGSQVQKQHVLLAVYKKWEVEFRDDNMCDSYVLAQIARQRDTVAGLLQYEQDVLAKLRDPKHRDWQPV